MNTYCIWNELHTKSEQAEVIFADVETGWRNQASNWALWWRRCPSCGVPKRPSRARMSCAAISVENKYIAVSAYVSGAVVRLRYRSSGLAVNSKQTNRWMGGRDGPLVAEHDKLYIPLSANNPPDYEPTRKRRAPPAWAGPWPLARPRRDWRPQRGRIGAWRDVCPVSCPDLARACSRGWRGLERYSPVQQPFQQRLIVCMNNFCSNLVNIRPNINIEMHIATHQTTV